MNLRAIFGTLVTLAFAATTQASVITTTVNFDSTDDGTALQHGQLVNPNMFDDYFAFSATTAGNEGPAIFNSNVTGSLDPDLQVGIGNLLIFQNSSHPNMNGSIFVNPNDATGSGTFTFAFDQDVTLDSVNLIDIDNGASVVLTLTDASSLSRVYSVPSKWTYDIATSGLPSTAQGWGTLMLDTLSDQLGEGGSTANALQANGFDPLAVRQLSIQLNGSGAISDLVFSSDKFSTNQAVPEPGTVCIWTLLGICGLVFNVWRRRR